MNDLLIAALAAWRVTRLLTCEEGPWGVFADLRAAAHMGQADMGFWGEVLACPWCASVWVGVGVALAEWMGLRWLLRALALSAGAIAMDEWINRMRGY